MKMKSDTKLVNELNIVKYLPKKKKEFWGADGSAKLRVWMNKMSSSREQFFFGWEHPN
jgi:hypothetical protein